MIQFLLDFFKEFGRVLQSFAEFVLNLPLLGSSDLMHPAKSITCWFSTISKCCHAALGHLGIPNRKVLKDHIMVKTLVLKVRNKEKELVDKSKPVILCCDLPKFIAHVMTERELESCTLKIGIDSGQGSFKICLTLLEACDDMIDLSVSLEYEKQLSENSSLGPPKSKRLKSSSSQSKPKPGSAKQLFIVGICHGIPELYENFSIFF